MDLLPAFLCYLVLCALVAVEAARQERFAVGFLFASFLLTPLVTLWYLILTPPGKPRGPVGPAYASVRTPQDRFRGEPSRLPNRPRSQS